VRFLRLRFLLLPALLALVLPSTQAGAGPGGVAAPSGGTAPQSGATSSQSGGASSQSGGASALTGGSSPHGTGLGGGSSPSQPADQPADQPRGPAETPPPAAPGQAVLLPNGKARAPKDAPVAVKRAIRAGNRLQGKPYRFGGGHARWEDDAYDCSGAVSYVLRGAGKLTSPLDSSGLMTWGSSGAGRWITVYANPNHTFVVVAGLRLDTGAPDERGPKWRTTARPAAAFKARHPVGL
jgi:cell wall-associated NlpC family hydrolase